LMFAPVAGLFWPDAESAVWKLFTTSADSFELSS